MAATPTAIPAMAAMETSAASLWRRNFRRGPAFDLTAKLLSSSTIFSIDNSNVSQNSAIAGDGSNGGDSTNGKRRRGGGGGDAEGGGLYSLLQVCSTNCSFLNNTAHAGDGGNGGDGTENSDTGGGAATAA